MVWIKKSDNSKCWWGCGEMRTHSHIVQENVNGVAALENSLAVIINLKFPQGPEI